jgi:hypothetical protein
MSLKLAILQLNGGMAAFQVNQRVGRVRLLEPSVLLR